MDRLFLGIAAVSGFLAVALGAFAAHGLQGRVPPHDLEIFEVGARYQMYHALALLAVAVAASRWSSLLFVAAGWCFIAGTVVFCGSLYALSLSGIRWLGAITPLGGLAFLAGWICLAGGAFFAQGR